jgi:hypothetical protein
LLWGSLGVCDWDSQDRSNPVPRHWSMNRPTPRPPARARPTEEPPVEVRSEPLPPPPSPSAKRPRSGEATGQTEDSADRSRPPLLATTSKAQPPQRPPLLRPTVTRPTRELPGDEVTTVTTVRTRRMVDTPGYQPRSAPPADVMARLANFVNDLDDEERVYVVWCLADLQAWRPL